MALLLSPLRRRLRRASSIAQYLQFSSPSSVQVIQAASDTSGICARAKLLSKVMATRMEPNEENVPFVSYRSVSLHDRLLPEYIGKLSIRHGVSVRTGDHLDRKAIFLD
jgi:hypothetical protein